MCSLTDEKDMCREVGYLYSLSGPDGSVRYIGYTTQTPEKRMVGHRWDGRNSSTHKSKWIRSIGVDNVTMNIISKHEYPLISELGRIEIELIAQAKLDGLRLTNGTSGGEGVKDPTPESRAKISAAHKGKVVSAEQRRKSSEALTGRKLGPRSDETKRKLSIANKGQIPWTKGTVIPLETREKISAAQRGKPNRGHHTKWHIGFPKGARRNETCIFCQDQDWTGVEYTWLIEKPKVFKRGNHTKHHTMKNIVNPDCSFCVAGTLEVGQNV